MISFTCTVLLALSRQVGSFHFTKYTHGNFNAMGCTGALFGDPPEPSHLERLCAETVWTLNDAMCDFYERPTEMGGCGAPMKCPLWKQPKPRMCEDSIERCGEWARQGECEANAGFMIGSCPKSCGK